MKSNIYDDFFNFNAPCPPEIPMCSKIREAYQIELSKASKSNCRGCAVIDVKARFLEAIWKEVLKANK